MNFNDFIENFNELELVALESNQMKEVNGGNAQPVSRINYQVTAEDAYILRYYQDSKVLSRCSLKKISISKNRVNKLGFFLS
jgi:hypothetical protein